MKKERIICIVSTIISLITVILKIGSGMHFKCSVLMISGYFSLVYLIHSILAVLFSLFENRRANKRYPFGLGRIEYISQIILGSSIIGWALFILFKSFNHVYISINLYTSLIVFICIILDLLNANILFRYGKKIRSEFLINCSNSMYNDFISSIIVLLLVYFAYVLPVLDFIGSIYIIVLIIIYGIKIVLNSLFILYGQDKNLLNLKDVVNKIIGKNKNIELSNIDTLLINDYYQLNIEIATSSNNVIDITRLEKEIIHNIRKNGFKVMLYDFSVIDR